jgi:integral membrane sensor domain MASE1
MEERAMRRMSEVNEWTLVVLMGVILAALVVAVVGR